MQRVHEFAQRDLADVFQTAQHNVVQQLVLERLQQVNLVGLVQRVLLRLQRLLAVDVVHAQTEHQLVGIVVGVNAAHVVAVAVFNGEVHVVHGDALVQHGLAAHDHADDPLGARC